MNDPLPAVARELFEAYLDGSLARRCADLGINLQTDSGIDTTALLPQWLHPRKSA